MFLDNHNPVSGLINIILMTLFGNLQYHAGKNDATDEMERKNQQDEINRLRNQLNNKRKHQDPKQEATQQFLKRFQELEYRKY